MGKGSVGSSGKNLEVGGFKIRCLGVFNISL